MTTAKPFSLTGGNFVIFYEKSMSDKLLVGRIRLSKDEIIVHHEITTEGEGSKCQWINLINRAYLRKFAEIEDELTLDELQKKYPDIAREEFSEWLD